MKKFSFLFILILFSSTIFGEEAFAPFSSKKGNVAAQKFKKSYDLVYDKFDKSMEVSRGFAAKQGNIEEIKKIQASLEGDFSQEFETPTAKTAIKSFKTNFQRLCKDYVSDLKTALKAELAAGNVDAAEELQPTIEKLEVNSKVMKYSTKTFRVEAEKGWQVSDIEVIKGDKVTLYCSGTWTAYQRSSKQDADTNKLELKIADSESIKSGKNSEFNAKKTGKISFRMDQRLKGKRNTPSGTLTVKVTRTPFDSFQKLHDLVLGLERKGKRKKENEEIIKKTPDVPKKSDRKKDRRNDRRDRRDNDFVPPPS